MSIADFLREQGVPEEEIAAAEAEGPEALQLLAADTLLLPDRPCYTGPQAAERAGIDYEWAKRLWRALGFPDVPEDEVAFGDADVEAMITLRGLIDAGVAVPEVALQLTRVFGQSLARVADAQVSSMRDRVEGPLRESGASDLEVAETITTVAKTMIPKVDDLLVYMWRRHLAAAARRTAMIGANATGGRELLVGFADLVGFTAISQQLDERELAAAVDRFENIAYDTVAEHGGRVVKMIGDEVMYVTELIATGTEIGLALAEVYGDDETLPDVRVGLAYGSVLAREGDYYGPTVNLASRIVNIAYAGTTVVSESVHDVLKDDPRFGWRALRPRRLKGIGLTPLWVVTRAGEERPLLPTEVRRRINERRRRHESRRSS